MTAALFFAGINFWMLYTSVKLPLSAYLGLCWLAIVWVLAYFSGLSSGYVSPDEVFFATKSIDNFFSNRTLWLAINQLTGLFTENVIETMRVLNFGFVILIYITAVRTFITLHPLFLAFALSYASCVAAFNFRDLAILLGVILFLDHRTKYGHSLADQLRVAINSKWILSYLFLLRPIQAVLLWASGLRWYLLAGGMVLTIAFLQTQLGSTYFYNFSYYTQNFNEAVSDKAEDKGFKSTQPTPRNIAFCTARFILAPSPMSVAQRVASGGGTYSYGLFDLSVRFTSRLAIYLLFMALLYYALRVPRITFDTFRANSFALKFGMLFSVLYAVFNFGASHERIKMIILVLAIFMVDRVRREYFSKMAR